MVPPSLPGDTPAAAAVAVAVALWTNSCDDCVYLITLTPSTTSIPAKGDLEAPYFEI